MLLDSAGRKAPPPAPAITAVGYYYDTETGLYYLTSRYYNPTWGRFINADDPGYMGTVGNIFALTCMSIVYLIPQ